MLAIKKIRGQRKSEQLFLLNIRNRQHCMRTDIVTLPLAFLFWLCYRRVSPSLSLLVSKVCAHMARAGKHTDVLFASQTLSFDQLMSLNPCLAVLFSGRLLSNLPPPNQKQSKHYVSLNLLPVCSEPTNRGSGTN